MDRHERAALDRWITREPPGPTCEYDEEETGDDRSHYWHCEAEAVDECPVCEMVFCAHHRCECAD